MMQQPGGSALVHRADPSGVYINTELIARAAFMHHIYKWHIALKHLTWPSKGKIDEQK